MNCSVLYRLRTEWAMTTERGVCSKCGSFCKFGMLAEGQSARGRGRQRWWTVGRRQRRAQLLGRLRRNTEPLEVLEIENAFGGALANGIAIVVRRQRRRFGIAHGK